MANSAKAGYIWVQQTRVNCSALYMLFIFLYMFIIWCAFSFNFLFQAGFDGINTVWQGSHEEHDLRYVVPAFIFIDIIISA